MKFAKLLSLVMFILLCISVSKASHAQWGFELGTYTTNPSSLSTGQGAVCDNQTCSANLTGDNGFYTYYSTQIYWTGDGEIQYSTGVKAVVSVSGSTPSGTGSRSTSTSNQPVAISVSGYSYNGSDNYPSPGTALVNGLYVETLTATLYCEGFMGGYNSPKPYSFAQVSYSLF